MRFSIPPVFVSVGGGRIDDINKPDTPDSVSPMLELDQVHHHHYLQLPWMMMKTKKDSLVGFRCVVCASFRSALNGRESSRFVSVGFVPVKFVSQCKSVYTHSLDHDQQ